MQHRQILLVWLAVVWLAVPSQRAPAADADAATGNASDRAFAEHLAELKRRMPTGFTVVPQPPFVVIGDETPATVRTRATNTVKWAVDRLKREYFERDPLVVIDIWLFRDRTSYTNHAWLLFQDVPATPFGYYSEEHRALIMNIATGGGTLVHEIVHPFMRANFPACPAWFNEGLASLYEQSTDRQGHIHGLLNWRFKGLEQTIKQGRTVPFPQLMGMSDTQFYNGTDSPNYSAHYAQARYLCYYLQEKGLLTKFYREFVANARRDPSGVNTLKRVLGEDDLAAFQKQWEKWVLGLRSAPER
jgi:hypothetical protein